MYLGIITICDWIWFPRTITIWLQIFIVENFCNFRNCEVIMKILFTKFSSQLIYTSYIEFDVK